VFLIGSTCLLIFVPLQLFKIWVGVELAQEIVKLILPLALANLVHQMTGPYTIALLGLGLQNKLWLSPAIEALAAVLFGILLGRYFGAIGVAYGVLLGSSMRLICTVFHDLRMTRSVLKLAWFDIVFPYNMRLFKQK
jgi:O-antigen/teichoic acid export membrane protein